MAFVLATTLVARPAAAQQHESAEELFQLGRNAMQKKDFARACGYFKASLDTEFALGTLLNLATCHEQEGKLASAWSEFRTLEDRAVRATPPQLDRAEFAHRRAEALRPRLSRVRFSLSTAARALIGLTVKVDGIAVDPQLYDAGVPLDQGDRKLVVEAPEHDPFTKTFRLDGEQQLLVVDVPGLPAARRAPKPVQVDLAEVERISAARSRRTAGLVVGAIGAGFLATGATFGILAKHADGQTTCAAPCYVTSAAYGDARDAYTRAKAFAWVADVGLGLGLAGLAVGTYLVVTTPRRADANGRRATVRLAPLGLFVEGTL